MTERLPTFAIEAITDAANLLMEMRRCAESARWSFCNDEHIGLRERVGAMLDNLNQIIDGQSALRDSEGLPFRTGETS